MNNIEQAIEDLKAGKMVIVTDDENRENEGDLVIAAEFITAEKMAFIIRHTGGVVCLSLEDEIANRLDLPSMVKNNNSKNTTAFTVSIEAAEGVSTGISAEDRATTILAAAAPNAKPEDLRRPGHIFPLRAVEGGVLCRAGHTEASVDLCRLAGLKPAAVISELINDDGTMMRMPALEKFSEQYNLSLISIADLIAYRHRHESFVKMEAEANLETDSGQWTIKIYSDLLHKREHTVLTKGNIAQDIPILVRVHSSCVTGDIFGSKHCDCGWQLNKAMKNIEMAGQGVILYMSQEGRGVGLVNKIKAYKLQQDEGLDTVDANAKLGLAVDLREYGIGAQVLRDLGLKKILLMTNNPKKINGIGGYGLEIVAQVPIEGGLNEFNKKYLKTKKDRMGHKLEEV
ncbi:MAG: bifunctional 3,4-dihydroxy-2-butanone-4-phosphate synthase/GTP cyclohydrolase II [Patescibacteria group bacterium]